jgi:hypothetical protein
MSAPVTPYDVTLSRRSGPASRRACTALALVAGWVLCAFAAVTPLLAQDAAGAPPEAEEFKQMALTDAQVTGFIAAQKELQPLSSKLLEGGEKPGDAVMAELESIAKKNGFQSFREMEDVGANITIVLDGLDRKTGAYTDPVQKMKQELDNIKADTSINDADKALVIEDLNQEIAAAKPLQFKDNIEVVKKHQDALENLVSDGTGESDGEGATGADPSGPPPAGEPK